MVPSFFMETEFDEWGNLTPYGPIVLKQNEFLRRFSEIAVQQHRKALLEKYRRYTMQVQAILQDSFTQFIDGSFVTSKPLPRDIDVVTFVPYARSLVVKNELEALFRTSRAERVIEGYFAWLPDEETPVYEDARGTYEYWSNFFSHSRYDEQMEQVRPKGFIVIHFNHPEQHAS